MSGAEQMHMLASTGINPNDSDIEFKPGDEKRYQKKPESGLRARASVRDAKSLRLVRVAKLLVR